MKNELPKTKLLRFFIVFSIIASLSLTICNLIVNKTSSTVLASALILALSVLTGITCRILRSTNRSYFAGTLLITMFLIPFISIAFEIKSSTLAIYLSFSLLLECILIASVKIRLLTLIMTILEYLLLVSYKIHCIRIECAELNDVQLLIAYVHGFLIILCVTTIVFYVLLKEYNRLVSTQESRIKQLEELVNYDTLTKLYTRSYFIDYSKEKLKTPAPYCVGIIDIDDFKKINDVYGHQVGDLVLSLIAAQLKQSLGSDTIVARYGGEEFVCLINQTIENSVLLMNDARESVSAMTWDFADVKVTLSGGLCELKDAKHIDEALNEADKCLYVAKNSGKNKIIY